MNNKTQSSTCHLCNTNTVDRGSGEHLPAKSSGNNGKITVHYVSGTNEKPQMLISSKCYQNGFWTKSLCVTCDKELGSKYVPY